MRRVTNRRVRSSGVGGELNVLLNSAVQGCPALQEGQRPIVLLLHVKVLVDDLRVDMGDYVDSVLLRQALCGERDLEVDILWRNDGQSQCRGLGATYANGWLIMVGASRTSPVPGNGMRRRHARRRILPSFRALRGDNTPIAALRGLRMITMAKCLQGCSLSCFGW